MTFNNPGLHLPRVRCHKCQLPINQLEYFYQMADHTHRLRVYCHGATDEMDISDYVLASDPTLVKQIRAQEGVAFGPKPADSIPNGNRSLPG